MSLECHSSEYSYETDSFFIIILKFKVFSLGGIFFLLLTNQVPWYFNEFSTKEQLIESLKNSFTPIIPNENITIKNNEIVLIFKNLIIGCMSKNPNSRPKLDLISKTLSTLKNNLEIL
jgi:serine/threonine protein kinase